MKTQEGNTIQKGYIIKTIQGFLQMKLKMYVGKEQFLAKTQTSPLYNQFSTLFTASYDKHFPIIRRLTSTKAPG